MKRFNPEKELKKSKRKYTKKHLVFSLLGLIGLTILGISFAYYDVNESSIVINGDVKAPINITVMKGEEQVTNFPTSAEGYEFDRVECINSTTYTWDKSNWQVEFNFTGNDDCVVYFRVAPYTDSVLAGSDPVLDSKMIPVNIADTGVVTVADTYDEWYNYTESKWANAVIVDPTFTTLDPGTTIPMTSIEQMYVWIPRYEYKKSSIVNAQESIEINFVPISKVNTDIENNDVIVHPAFTFGGVGQVGLWVGKFEMGWQDDFVDNKSVPFNDGIETTYIIKPNVNPATRTNISTMYYNIQGTKTTYSMDSTTDVHMIKNTEWGAVAYLSQSKYGICEDDVTCSVKIENNNYNNYTFYDIVTGCGGNDDKISSSNIGVEICPASNRWETESGVKASTTHNITGIYDMAGGHWEAVMGNMQDSSGNFYSSSAGFTTTPEAKYYDSYANGTNDTDYTRGLYGDATVELNITEPNMSNWNSDLARFVRSNFSWVYRGGSVLNTYGAAGIWHFSQNSGYASPSLSTRPVISSVL